MTRRSAVTRERISEAAASVRRRALPVLFGDRVGLALFLGVVVALSTVLRVGFFITDSYAIANTVVNVADGHLAITRIEYSLTLGSQPGLYRHGTGVFGRNYGQAVLALPFYWLLESASTVVELRLLLAGGWSLLLAAFSAQLGRLLDRQQVTLAGTVLALLLFVAAVALARPLDPRWTALLALQLLALVAAGVVAVSLYRLASEFHGRRVGVAAGVLAALSLPIAFWSASPKRHVLSAALIALVVFAFARSRRTGSPWTRGLAYATVGMLAWVHAAEALAVLVVLVPVDLLTAPRNDRRTLATVAVVFGLALVPFALTNIAITGSPFETPRMLSSLGDAASIGPDGRVTVDTGGGGSTPPPTGNESTPPPTGNETTPPPTGNETTPPPTGNESTVTPGSSTGSSGPGPFAILIGLLDGIVAAAALAVGAISSRLGLLQEYVSEGIQIVTDDSERLWHVFVRSGRVPGVNYSVNDQEAIELTVLEVAPVLGVLAVLPLVWTRRAFDGGMNLARRIPATLRSTPRYQTDLFAALLVVVFTLLYLPKLPVHAQITMRYLVPVMPVALYGVVRIPAVRRGIDRHWRQFALAYLWATVVGTVGTVVVFASIRPAIGEAMQFHALLNLAVAGVATLLVAVAFFDGRDGRVATAIGVAGGAGTALFALSGIEYFTYGEFLFPVARWLSALLPLF